MKEILLHRGEHLRTFAFVLDPDEDPIEVLTERARMHSLSSCQVTAVGGFSRVTPDVGLALIDHGA